MTKDMTIDARIGVVEGKPVELPSGAFVANAAMTREGADLHLTSPDGHTIVVEGYFAQNPAPDLVTPDGAFLPPDMVSAFLPPEHAGQYADSGQIANDASPAGKITEIVGEASIIRADGTRVAAEVNTPIYQGDVVETSKTGAVNILFSDNTTFAISENARMSVDQFVYHADDHSGSSFFSMLQGMFVYTSGLIGKTDPGSVSIETPVGSIGIRGTVVAGHILPAGQDSTITILDGAIALTNGSGTQEMNSSFETMSVSSYQSAPVSMGQMDSGTFSATYQALAPVANDTISHFSGIVAPVPAGTTEAPADAAPAGDAPATDGTAPPATDATTAPSTDAAVAPPTSDQPVQTAPTDDTAQPVAQPDGPLPPPPSTENLSPLNDPAMAPLMPPPPPPGSNFTGDASGSTMFSPPPGTNTTFNTTTTVMDPAIAPPPTDTTTTGTNTTITSPPPAIGFHFAPEYLHGTPLNTSDDGIYLLGDDKGLFSLLDGWSGIPVAIGKVVLNDFPPNMAVNIMIEGDKGGTTIVQNTDTPSPALYDTTGAYNPNVFSYNSLTHELFLNDPFAMLSDLNPGGFTFTASASVNGTTYTHDFTILLKDTLPPGMTVLMGSAGDDSPIWPATSGAELIYGDAGNDVFGGGGGGDYLIGGAGNDRIDIFTSNHLSALRLADGGDGFDTLQLGSTSNPGQMFDFRNTNNVHHIERIQLAKSSSIGSNDIELNIRDVFEMTGGFEGGNHTLRIGRADFNDQISIVTIDNSRTDLANLTHKSTTGQMITYEGTFLNQTVTLVINQGVAPGGIQVNELP